MRLFKAISGFTLVAMGTLLPGLVAAEEVVGTSFFVERVQKAAVFSFGETSIVQVPHENNQTVLVAHGSNLEKSLDENTDEQRVPVSIVVEGNLEDLRCLKEVLDKGLGSISIHEAALLKEVRSGEEFDKRVDYRLKVEDLEFSGSRPILDQERSVCAVVESIGG